MHTSLPTHWGPVSGPAPQHQAQHPRTHPMNSLRLSHARALTRSHFLTQTGGMCLLLCGLILLASSISNGQESGKPTPGWQVTVTAKEKIVITSPQGNEMICRFIAPGEFAMGNKDGYLSYTARQRYYGARSMAVRHAMDEGPVRKTTITKGYYMLDTKVWTALYCEFLNETEKPEECHYARDRWMAQYARFERDQQGKYAAKEGTGKTAVNTTTWGGAVTFCEWMSQKSGRKVRLPTEAEWEYAAKGKEGRVFPWGNKHDIIDGYDLQAKTPLWKGKEVKSTPANATPTQLYDMVGSVAEWCSDWYAPDYDLNDNIDPTGPPKEKLSSIKGMFHHLKVQRGGKTTTTLRGHRGPIPEWQSGQPPHNGFRFVVEE